MDEFIESSPVKDDDFDCLLGLDAEIVYSAASLRSILFVTLP